MSRRLALVLAACSIGLLVLAAGLRPDAFFVGDPGIKLISARNALRFPTHPLDIPLPQIGAIPVPHVEPFFAVHEDHSHAVTSEFFPLLSAPLLRAFGLRGVYLLPAAGFIGALAACAWLASVLDARANAALAAATVALGTPFLFYGLEFWEHMPAVALAVSGSALMLHAARQRTAGQPASWRDFTAGLLFGAAVVLRAEAAAFVAATMIASRTLTHRPTWRSLAAVAAGVVVAVLPLEGYTLLHFGTLVPGHVDANARLLGNSWAAERAQLASDWLLPSLWTTDRPVRSASLWSVSPAAVVALFATVGPSRYTSRMFLWMVTAITIGLVVLIAPNGGGGQWGPRYLLLGYVPLALLAAGVVEQVPRRSWGIAALVVMVVVSVWVQRAAYRQLRGSKATYGRLTDFVRMMTTPGGYVLTDVWWLDQLAASSLQDKTTLFAGDAPSGRDILHRLSDLVVPTVTVFRSTEESADVDSWSAATCYFEEAREGLPVRGVVGIRLRHRCGYKP
jgi:hypothetical protein